MREKEDQELRQVYYEPVKSISILDPLVTFSTILRRLTS